MSNCRCGHAQIDHIYEHGACRPGFICEDGCDSFHPRDPYVCPSALNIRGEHFPCQQMDQMLPGSLSHDGWAHSNRDAQAIWGEPQ